jgi:hypothetical protein
LWSSFRITIASDDIQACSPIWPAQWRWLFSRPYPCTGR